MEQKGQRIFKELGKVYYRYEDDTDKLIQKRVVGIQNIDTIRVMDMDTKEVTKMDFDILIEDYIPLLADGFITFNIVSMSSTRDLKDIVVCLYKKDDIESGIPYAVCRQCVTDVYYNLLKTDPDMEMTGMSVTQDTCPVELDFNALTACNSLIQSIGINIYLTDTLDIILSMFKTDRFDSIMENNLLLRFNSVRESNPFLPKVFVGDTFDGYCRTLKLLLQTNNFMYDFYTAFKVIPIKTQLSPIVIGNDLVLSDIDKKSIFEDALRLSIKDSIIVPYSKEVDLEKIKMGHMVIKDCMDMFYIVGFTLNNDEYIPHDDVDDAISTHERLLNKLSSIVDYYDKY